MLRVALLALSLGVAATAQETARITWEKLATARDEAARDGRPLLLYFTFDT